MAMKFKLISPEGPEYYAERILRWEILSKPLGIPPGSEAPPEELRSLHLVALDGKRLVGCVCFHPESDSEGRIFELAVSEEQRGRGFGRQLLHKLEHMLIQRGIKNIYLFSPPDWEEFYTLMGYQPEAEVIVKMGIKQRRMKKTLHASTPHLNGGQGLNDE